MKTILSIFCSRSVIRRFSGVVLAIALPIVFGSTAVAQTAPSITAGNWYWGPGNRWSYKHTRRVFPSANISRGVGPVAPLEYAPKELDRITFSDPQTRKRMTVAEWYGDTFTDAFLVMKDGKILTERYFNGMRDHDTHLLMSTTKSVVGALTGIVVEQGLLDVNALVTEYVPEMKGTAFEGATVEHVLDMSVALDYNGDYSSKDSDVYRLDESTGWVPRGESAAKGLHDYLTQLVNVKGKNGDRFNYASPMTDLMAWILERATDTDFAELMSREIWSKLGAERDAYVLLDGYQNAYTAPGLNMTLRDFGRFGQMMLQNGVYNGQRIIPDTWIQDIRKNGDKAAWKRKGASSLSTVKEYENGSYRNYWYVANDEVGRYMGIGLAGQRIIIDPASGIVIIKFSSYDSPKKSYHETDYAASAAIIKALSE